MGKEKLESTHVVPQLERTVRLGRATKIECAFRPWPGVLAVALGPNTEWPLKSRRVNHRHTPVIYRRPENTSV